MLGGDEDAVRNTGGQVDELIMALIDSAFDKDERVRDTMCSSIYELGKNKPALVLSSCYSYLVKHAKLPQGHRVVILQCMERIIKVTLEDMDKSLAEQIIMQASHEMTASKDVIPDWQTAASDVLVAIGGKFCTEVMADLQDKFQPGVLPHFFVVQTMANLATSNVYGMVPFLKVILGTMLPMLGMAKQDNLRWVFSTALARFSEAIIDYVANLEKAPDLSVKKEVFSVEIDAAYDIVFHVWLQSKEPKLRLSIVEAIGQMAHIMTREKLEEQLPKLLQGILALYKKHPEPYHITQGLCMILQGCTADGSTILDPYLDNLLNTLFPQTCQPIDYSSPFTVKNHNELLRCFAVLAVPFSDRVIVYLLLKLEQSNERIRVGSLAIFRHLINSAGSHMEDKKPLIISGLKGILNDPNNKIKKSLAQTIMAMAYHNYLELEGGQLMIEFIVRQCSLLPDQPGVKRPNDPEFVSNDALRSMCDSVLQLLSNTVENMDHVLWPYLLECIVPEQYTDAMGSVCRSVASIANKKRQEKAEDYEINYEQEVNVPKPPALIARLMVMAGRPNNGRARGLNVLSAMQGLSPNLHENLVELWDQVIPKLTQYLEDCQDDEEKWSQKSWEDLALKMLSKSLDVVDDEDWICDLGNAMAQQVPLYNMFPEEKNFLFKSLGIVLRKSTKKDFVDRHISTILGSVKHASQLEREGCAIALGFTAASHIDQVLTKLDLAVKNEAKRSSGLFNFIKESVNKSDLDEKCKATFMLCYGYVTLYAPTTVITSRIETSVLKNVLPHYINAKDPVLKQALIKTAELIGRALHPDHLQSNYPFTHRGDLITYLQNYLKAEPTNQLNNETRALILQACATLVKLEPVLAELEAFELLKAALDSFLPLPPGGMSANKKSKEETYSELIEQETYMKVTQEALQELLQELILKEKTPQNLDRIFKMLHLWTLSLHEHERERAITLCLVVFNLFLQRLDPTIGETGHFSTLGLMLGRLVPRCSDPNVNIRLMTLDCIIAILKISHRYQGTVENLPESYWKGKPLDQLIETLPNLKERIKKNDPSVMFSVVNDIAKVLCKSLPPDQVLSFMEMLYEGLQDPQDNSSSGACVVLNSVIKARGGELTAEVDTIVRKLILSLREIVCPQTKTGTMRSIRTLAAHHLMTVLSTLLSFPIPFDSNLVDCWQTLAQDPSLTPSIIDHILDLLLRSLPYDEKLDSSGKPYKNARTAMVIPLAATSALCEMFKVAEMEAIVKENYHRLLAAAMLRMASTVGVKPPTKTYKEDKSDSKSKKDKKTKMSHPASTEVSPSRASVAMFRQLLKCSNSNDVQESLTEEDLWDLFEDPQNFQDAFTVLARLIVVHQPEYVSKLINVLNPALSSVYEPQRVACAAFFSELINQKCGGDLALVEMLVNGLLGRLVDSSHVVRMLCIRGLGNVSSCGKDQVGKYSTTVLSAMMAGMDDKEDLDDDITLEAMSGLSRVLAEIDESHIRAILINISLRIRPCFEKEKESVRAAAFILFGNLCRFADGPSKEPFLEQIHTNLVSLLLHLNDPHMEVRKACKFALRQMSPLLGSETIDKMCQEHLLDSGSLHYGEFMNDLSKAIIQDFPDKLNFYVMGNVTFFKSSWPEIKCNASMFEGFLLGNAGKEKYAGISKEHVCGALIMLLKDSNPDVRIKAAEAMSQLHDF